MDWQSMKDFREGSFPGPAFETKAKGVFAQLPSIWTKEKILEVLRAPFRTTGSFLPDETRLETPSLTFQAAMLAEWAKAVGEGKSEFKQSDISKRALEEAAVTLAGEAEEIVKKIPEKRGRIGSFIASMTDADSQDKRKREELMNCRLFYQMVTKYS